MELISRWSDFGMKYRGRWNPTNSYSKKDVIWIDLGKEIGLGTESYFICQEEHIAGDVFDKELWTEYK